MLVPGPIGRIGGGGILVCEALEVDHRFRCRQHRLDQISWSSIWVRVLSHPDLPDEPVTSCEHERLKAPYTRGWSREPVVVRESEGESHHDGYVYGHWGLYKERSRRLRDALVLTEIIAEQRHQGNGEFCGLSQDPSDLNVVIDVEPPGTDQRHE